MHIFFKIMKRSFPHLQLQELLCILRWRRGLKKWAWGLAGWEGNGKHSAGFLHLLWLHATSWYPLLTFLKVIYILQNDKWINKNHICKKKNKRFVGDTGILERLWADGCLLDDDYIRCFLFSSMWGEKLEETAFAWPSVAFSAHKIMVSIITVVSNSVYPLPDFLFFYVCHT